jgi:hypothetical protein
VNAPVRVAFDEAGCAVDGINDPGATLLARVTELFAQDSVERSAFAKLLPQQLLHCAVGLADGCTVRLGAPGDAALEILQREARCTARHRQSRIEIFLQAEHAKP